MLNTEHVHWHACIRACSLTTLTLAAVGCGTFSPAPDHIEGIAAGTIAVISDGDYVAASYGTGELAPLDAGHRDLLSVLSVRDGELVRGELAISSSVTASPEVLALSPDGRTAFITERLGERAEGDTLVSQLAPGRRLFAVDVSDPAAPRLSDTTEVAAFPEALAVSPDGQWIAVVSNPAEASYVQLVHFNEGRFEAALRFDVAALGVVGTADGPRGGVLATNVHWHPTGRYLAVNFNTLARVGFFELHHEGDDNGAVSLRAWGNLAETGPDSFVGRFTPDGRYYVTSDWGRNFAAADLEGRLPATRSLVSLIRVASPGAEAPQHARVATAESDIAAEGIAISPDGRLIATINMRGTAFPPDSARHTPDATVSLLALDAENGTLEKLADTPFAGVLPEGGTFDLTGRRFIATSFEGPSGATLEVFDVTKGPRPTLEHVASIPVPHGAHHVAVSR
ncbi:MAG: hypothetical protein ABW321_07250 [Polyangiales bacterium]